jgi:hypothetical protein
LPERNETGDGECRSEDDGKHAAGMLVPPFPDRSAIATVALEDRTAGDQNDQREEDVEAEECRDEAEDEASDDSQQAIPPIVGRTGNAAHDQAGASARSSLARLGASARADALGRAARRVPPLQCRAQTRLLRRGPFCSHP